MTNQIKNGGVIAKAAETKAVATTQPKNLKDWVQEYQAQFAKALPKVITADRFTRIALSALSNTPQLMECDPKSFLGALMQAAQLGVEPNTPLGQAYLIPFKNTKKGITEAQFQLGYKGLIDLAYRSEEIAVVQAHIVYENDKFEYALGLDVKLTHVPAMSNRGKATHVYGIFKTKNGGYGFEVMSMDDIKNHAQKYSQAYKTGYSPWTTNFEEMAKKTVLKRVLKYAPLRSDFITADSTVSHLNDKTNEPTIVYDNEVVIDGDTGEILNASEQEQKA